MSATKAMRKWVKTATLDELGDKNAAIQNAMIGQSNRMILSSLKQQLAIVKAEQYRRGLIDGAKERDTGKII